MPRPAGFSDRDVLVIEIADLTDGRDAVDIHQSRLARRQLHVCVSAFFRHQLRGSSGASRHLRTLAGTQFDVVDGRAERDVLQRKRIADENVRFGPGTTDIPTFSPTG